MRDVFECVTVFIVGSHAFEVRQERVEVPRALVVTVTMDGGREWTFEASGWRSLVVIRNCVLLREWSSAEGVDTWWAELQGDIPRIETVLNEVHLWELFESGIAESHADDQATIDALREMAEIMVETWRVALAKSFPGRSFVVECSNGPDDYGPTIWFHSVSRTGKLE